MAPRYNKLFLSSRISVQDWATTLILRSLYVARIPCIFEVVERLYWDEKKNAPRPGMIRTETKPGGLEHRFIANIQQLECTFDLQCLNADQLLELLGDEFRFKSSN